MCLVLVQCPTYKEEFAASNPMKSRQYSSTCAYHKAYGENRYSYTLAIDETLLLSYTSSVVS
jgi:hypothetical protein